MKVNENELHSPWLSVIIPIYNAEKFLCECIDSILEQTFTDFEVLLIDDGSTDTSPNICQKYLCSDSRVRYYKKENGGSCQSRIYGAERALGEYVIFCDSDDFYVNRNVFDSLHREIIKSGCSASQFSYIKKYNHLKRRVASVDLPINVDARQFLCQEYPKLLCSFWDNSHLTTSVCDKIFHRSLFSNLPKSDSVEKIFFGDDQILNLYLLSTCESFRFIPATLYCYRQFSGDTNRFSKNTMKDVDNIKKYQLMFLEQYKGESKDSIRNKIFSELAGWFFIYVKQALEHLEENELLTLIEEILGYPRFVLAREYYIENSDKDWEGANLLRKGDAKEYISSAKICRNKRGIKEGIRNILRKIYVSI